MNYRLLSARKGSKEICSQIRIKFKFKKTILPRIKNLKVRNYKCMSTFYEIKTLGVGLETGRRFQPYFDYNLSKKKLLALSANFHC